jgi:hypothetical protein
MGEEDGVVGAVDDAEQEHREVISHLLTSSMLYQLICCMTSFIVSNHIRIIQRDLAKN